MATADERLRQIWPKVERAKKHINDVNVEVLNFLKTDPYKVGTKRDSQTRKPIYYVTSVERVPSSVPLIAGDAIQNLMSALDHLAYQIVCVGTNDNPPNPYGIYFPIGDSATEYKARKLRNIQGARPSAIEVIDEINRTKEEMTCSGNRRTPVDSFESEVRIPRENRTPLDTGGRTFYT